MCDFILVILWWVGIFIGLTNILLSVKYTTCKMGYDQNFFHELCPSRYRSEITKMTKRSVPRGPQFNPLLAQ